jgi:hypothetical protein
MQRGAGTLQLIVIGFLGALVVLIALPMIFREDRPRPVQKTEQFLVPLPRDEVARFPS